MSKGNVNDNLKLLANNMSKGNLPLSKKILGFLKQKYPKRREASPETLPEGPFRSIDPVAHDGINESLAMQAGILTKGVLDHQTLRLMTDEEYLLLGNLGIHQVTIIKLLQTSSRNFF